MHKKSYVVFFWSPFFLCCFGFNPKKPFVIKSIILKCHISIWLYDKMETCRGLNLFGMQTCQIDSYILGINIFTYENNCRKSSCRCMQKFS